MAMTKHEFLTNSGVQVQTLEVWVEQQWLIPEQTPSGRAFPTWMLRVRISSRT
jgi:chaperone modulatory protein CbpM